MKIAYISLFYSRDNMSGVEKKLREEAPYYVDKGIDVYLLNRKQEGFIDNIFYKKVDQYFSMGRFFELYLRIFTFSVIEKIIDLEKYDRIYLRYPMMDFSAVSFAKKYGYKVITQHHTKELEEIKKLNLNKLFKTSQYIMEKFLAPHFFKYISGLTAMSDDVLAYEKERVSFKGKLHRFSNGINPRKFIMHKVPKLHDVFHLTIIASSFSPWHGLDRLIKSLMFYHDTRYKIHLHVVGEVSNNTRLLIGKCKENENIIVLLHGKLFGQDLDEVFSTTHVACDSLAMHRLEMKESSTLKSKEYIARGIPFIYSAFDQDMQNIKRYLYDVKNNESLIDLQKIISFYKSLEFKNMQKDMERCVEEVLTWRIKIEHLVVFLRKK
ncbi:MAG: glycosyltransferase [Sulfurovum sp.]|nr:glycosyltransferase [Sulfurovum sp.]